MGFVLAVFASVCILLYAASLVTIFPLPKHRSYGKRTPKVSIILAALNEEKVIEKTLRSLGKTGYPDYEIIVVCQGSDSTAAIAKKYARVIRDRSKGKWHALGLGANAAKGEILYILDADSTPERGALGKLVGSIGEHGVATGITVEEGSTPTAMVFRLQTAFTNYAQYVFSRFLGTGIIQGKNYVISKKTLHAIGGFRKAVLEDANMTFRLYLAGKKVSVVDAKCREQAPPKFKWYLKQQLRWTLGEQAEISKLLREFRLKDWFTLAPLGIVFGYVPPISAAFMSLFILTSNQYFALAALAGFITYLCSAIKFLKPKDVVFSLPSFVALSGLQIFLNLYAMLALLSGKKEIGGRTEKA
ncbi:MAG: glycosyltransferase family 2 protein [Candidatus Aenigmarchaeota archaeon]|nr:glycosyltransferase family 2 protein [Candidatus Aenigmarchaeota archaeon]